MNPLPDWWLDFALAGVSVGNSPATPFGWFVFYLMVIAVIIGLVVYKIKERRNRF